MTTITTVTFGSVTFTGAQIKEARVVEEIDPLAIELHIGTLELTLFSADGDFSIINPSGFYASLQYKQPLEVTETIDGTPYYIGKFYLETWESVSANEAKFRAIDAVGLLDTIMYDGFQGGDNTYAGIIADIMAFAGLTYNLDSSFTGSQYVHGWINKCTCREALQQVAFDIGAYVTCARDDVINILPFKLASSLTTYDYTIQTSQKGLGQPITLLPLVTGVELTSHLYLTGENADYESLFKGAFAAGNYRLFFGLDVPVWDTFSITGATNTSTGDWRGTYIDINVAAPGTVEILGAKYRDAQQLHAVYNGSLPVGTQPNIVQISDCTLVTSFVQAGYMHADTVAQRVYDYFQQKYLQKVRLFAHPLKVGDSVLVAAQTGWIGGIVERVEIDLAHGFISQIEVVGVVASTCTNILTADLIVPTGNDQTYADCLDMFTFNVDLQGTANLIIN